MIYMCLMSVEFIKQCKLEDMFDEVGFVHVEVHGCTCGFPQTDMLAHKDLVKRIIAHGCKPATFTPELWCHEINDIHFTLVVDDLEIKHTSIANINHLIKVLRQL